MHHKTKLYFLIVPLITPGYLSASVNCDKTVAQMLSTQGKVDTQHLGSPGWLSAKQDDEFCPGDKIRTAKWSRATLRLGNESIVTLDQSSTLMFSEPETKTPGWLLSLMDGVGFFRSRRTQQLNIKTPFVNAVHEGTEFLVRVDDTHTEITVFDGRVAAQNKAGRVQIKQGYSAITQKGQAPRTQPLLMKPEDAVQWALYYPAIIDDQNRQNFFFTPGLQAALRAYRQGDTYQALAGLEALPATQQDTRYFTLKAALLLNVGRVDEAQNAIDTVLDRNANNSVAFAFQSVIAVSKNRQNAALELARKAVSLDPQSAAAYMSLSYACQALFKLEGALQAAQEATRLSPENALAWARLSELQLSMDKRDDALISAQKAQVLNPALARSQSVLGFANLAQHAAEPAKKSFARAIALDSSDPLARLGLGLAKISEGKVDEGAKELEIAVNLDPNNAVIRSYLGKAYYELRNKTYAGTEFKIAKEMDPKDPTPWFYDAILKQTNNQPVAALHDIQKAMELNDNRAVYRSRLLLDKDAAVRGTGLGRIYNDLGFDDVANRQAIKSLAMDPTNYSAQRLLSDSYATRPRHELARSSALLQSQLLQSLNLNPVQPRLAYTDLNISKSVGPAEVGFNEYNKVFERDYTRLTNTVSYGSYNTLGNEAVFSGLQDKFSYSLGQLHYETDGFRANNDIKHDLYDVFAQYEFSPKLSLQAEYRRRDSTNGDLELKGSQTDFDENFRRDLGQDTYRVGLKFSPVQHSDILLSYIHANRDDRAGSQSIASEFNNRGDQLESAYLFHTERFNSMIGGGTYSFDTRKTINSSFFVCQFIPCGASNFNTTQNFGYVYSNFKFFNNVTATAGLAYDTYRLTENQGLNVNELNPKFGLLWSLNDYLTLRLAVFKTLKSPIVVDQIIQPMQIAGFNQFFDDFNGTKATQYGIGLDSRLAKNVYMGLEAYQRDLDIPVNDFFGKVNFEKNVEDLYRLYFNWIPFSNWIVNSEFRFENFQSLSGGALPKLVETAYLPLSLRYFHPEGFFAELKGTYVNQNVDPMLYGNESFCTDFYLVDAAIGYRLPKQYGMLTLEAKNLLDNNFKFRDRNFQTNEKRASDIIPEQTLLARFTFNF